MANQTTLVRSVQFTDIGLHSGMPVSIVLKPAAADSGIVFFRDDLPGKPGVKASVRQVTSTLRATTLENGEARVFTVEHLLSALYALGVDNCAVEMSAPETPVGDGSALPFVRLIEAAGTVELPIPRKVFRVAEPVGH